MCEMLLHNFTLVKLDISGQLQLCVYQHDGTILQLGFSVRGGAIYEIYCKIIGILVWEVILKVPVTT